MREVACGFTQIPTTNTSEPATERKRGVTNQTAAKAPSCTPTTGPGFRPLDHVFVFNIDSTLNGRLTT